MDRIPNSEDENERTARIRDEALRKALNTPPQPKHKPTHSPNAPAKDTTFERVDPDK